MIFVDTSVPAAPPVTEAFTPDRQLRARSDADRGGVWLEATVTDAAATVEAVRVERLGSDGRWAPVFSGDPAPAIADRAIAYDHHAPSGPATYRARALDRAGQVVASTGTVTLTLPTWLPSIAWIKVLRRPSLSMQVEVILPMPEDAIESRADLVPVPGGLRAGTWDTPLPAPRTYQWIVDGVEQLERFRALCAAGEVLLQLQPPHGEPDRWCLITAASAPFHANPVHRARRISAEFTPIEPPTTVDSPLRVPQTSHRDLADLSPRGLQALYPGFRSTSTGPATDVTDEVLPETGSEGGLL